MVNMINFGNIWVEDEDNFIIENYPDKGLMFCSERLNRTKRAVQQRAKRLKVKMTSEAKYLCLRKYQKEDVEVAVKKSYCIADVCRYYGLYPQAGNYKNFKKVISFYNINTDHFLTTGELSKIRNSTKKQDFTEKKLGDCLVENSNFSRTILKMRLYESGLKKRECEVCGQDEFWFGKKMTLILDHINGVNNDNRLENLRILCPNCNSTLDTHCSKNRKTKKEREIKIFKSRIPTSVNLILDFRELKTFTSVGKKYGVSDNSVRKWCKKYDIIDLIKHPCVA